MQLLAEMPCDLAALIAAQNSWGSSCAHFFVVVNCVFSFIYIDTVETLSVIQLYCCGTDLPAAEKYHIRIIVNQIHILFLFFKGLQNGSILKLASVVLWGLDELDLHVFLCVCWPDSVAGGWRRNGTEGAEGEKDSGMLWWSSSTPLPLWIFVSHSQVCGTLRGKKSDNTFSLFFAIEYLPYVIKDKFFHKFYSTINYFSCFPFLVLWGNIRNNPKARSI